MERYRGFGVRVDQVEDTINKKELAFKIFNTFSGEAQFNSLSLKETLEIERRVDKTQDHRFYKVYKKRLLIKKLTEIKDISRKTNLIRKDDFNFIMPTAKFLVAMERICKFIQNGDKYEDLKTWGESIIEEKDKFLLKLKNNYNKFNSKFCKKVLFNFLDISEDMENLKQRILEEEAIECESVEQKKVEEEDLETK